MKKDDDYYSALDTELTKTVPEIDFERQGSLGSKYANIVVLSDEDMRIVHSLAGRQHMTVSGFLSQTIRRELEQT